MNSAKWRVAAGIAVLVLLAVVLIRLTPPYLDNWKLQQYLNEVGANPAYAARPPADVRSMIVAKAAALGLPVSPDDVQISRNGTALKIEVLYIVHVTMAAYAVDLHFRPATGGT